MKIEKILNIVQNKESAFFYTPHRFEDGKSYLFQNPVEKIVINNFNQIETGLKQVDKLLDSGLIGYGFITYEAGYAFEERLRNVYGHNPEQPYIHFVFCEPKNVLEIVTKTFDFSDLYNSLKNELYAIQNFHLNISKEKYFADIKKIKEYIKEGDTYQVNYTLKNKFNFSGSVTKLFVDLSRNQSAAYTTLINTGFEYVISISPELFFKVEDNNIITTPMKGTIKRGHNQSTDDKNKLRLKESIKDKAENIMIVDLLRNDLGKISEIDSVVPEKIYNIEKYESVFQMVSTISSTLKKNKFSEIIKSIFPCGSITGAPKIRTMRIINKLEPEPRNIYTGALGLLNKDNYIFNVPIRTITIDQKTGKSELGLGSGIVWDSDAEEEYKEAMLKGKFLTEPDPYFEIIESFLIEDSKVFLGEYHLQRIKDAVDYFIFNFDENGYSDEINNLINLAESDKKYKARISIDKWGNFKSSITEINENPNLISVNIASDKINSQNKFLYFKTTNRGIYDTYLNDKSLTHFFDHIFFNEKGELCEGARCNIIIEKNGLLYTPVINSGLLNGCYRKYLIDKNDCIEKTILKAELLNADKVYLTNSVRKLVQVTSLYYKEKLIKQYE